MVNDVVVVGVDDSPGARAALAWAARYAASTGARLRIVHAYEFNLAWIDAASPDLPLWEQRARITAEDALARIVTGTFGGRAPDGTELRTVQGPPSAVLYEEGRTASLPVVGTRGRGGFASLLLGSVSQRLTQHAPCPVVVPPPHERA